MAASSRSLAKTKDQHLKSCRVLIVSLTLTALVLSNLAGWVHVGCATNQSGCCLVAGADACTASDRNPQRSRSCCHHHGDSCRSNATAPVGEQTHPPAGKSADQSDSDPSDSDQSDSEHPGEPHDSDRCSVCQNFFASRHAVFVADVDVVMAPLAVRREIVFVDDVYAPSTHLRCDTVRGPPSV